MRNFIILTCLLASSPLLAQVLPPAGYFAGDYELVGRTPGIDGTAILDWVTLTADSDADDATMTLNSCRRGEGDLRRNTSSYEGASPLVGRLGDWQLFCRYASDGDNYPRLTCYVAETGKDGAAGVLTFWPAHSGKPDHAADCE